MTTSDAVAVLLSHIENMYATNSAEDSDLIDALLIGVACLNKNIETNLISPIKVGNKIICGECPCCHNQVSAERVCSRCGQYLRW